MRFSFMLALLCACTPVMGHQVAAVGNDTEVWPEDPVWVCQPEVSEDTTTTSFCSIVFADQIEGDGRKTFGVTGLDCSESLHYPGLSNRCSYLPITDEDLFDTDN